MIQLVSQPAKWTSAYDSVVYTFYDYDQYAGLSFSASTSPSGYGRLDVNGMFDSFAIGKRVDIDFGGGYNSYTIIATEGTDYIVFDYAGFALSGTGSVRLYNNSPLVLRLLAGYKETSPLYSSSPLALVAEFKAIAKDHLYTINIAGYLQDVFRDVDPPPVTGHDPDQHIHYRVTAKYAMGSLVSGGAVSDTAFLYDTIGDVLCCVNGCVESVNASAYVTTPGKPLQHTPVIKHNSKQALYSYILDDAVITKLI